MLATPSTMKEPRHDRATISHATSGGVIALPRRANAWVNPCANPRREAAVQLAIARVAAGKVAPSPNPSISLAATSETNPTAKPLHTVAPAQINPQTEQRAACAETITDPSAYHLEYQIGIGERRKHETYLRVGQGELLLEHGSRGAHVDAVHIGDEVHQAQQP